MTEAFHTGLRALQGILLASEGGAVVQVYCLGFLVYALFLRLQK